MVGWGHTQRGMLLEHGWNQLEVRVLAHRTLSERTIM